MDSNLVIFSLEHTYLVCSGRGIFESDTGLWQNHLEWSRALIPYNIIDQHAHRDIRVIDNMNPLRQKVMSLNHNGISEFNHVKLVEPQLNNDLITISINGNEAFVNNSRSEILKSFKRMCHTKLVLTQKELKAINSDFLQRLNGVALQFEVEISISDWETDFKGHRGKSNNSFVYIIGDAMKLNQAKTHVKVLVDSLLSGFFIDQVQIPESMVPCLGGVGFLSVMEIMREFKVRMYLPDFSHFFSRHEENAGEYPVSIWLTADRIAEISMARIALQNRMKLVGSRGAVSKKMYFQNVTISREKLDLISLFQGQEISSLMLKHGTLIHKCYSKKSRSYSVLIRGSTPHSVENTAREISSLSCQIYHLDLSFAHASATADLEYFLIGLVNFKKSCVVIHNEYGLSFLGTKKDIHLLLKELMMDLEEQLFFYNALGKEKPGLQIALKMELANEQKEFLSGKKKGKITKILNQLGNIPKISFLKLNDFNFLIEPSVILGSGIKRKQLFTAFDLLMRTMYLIEMEYPAELQFNIPEVFHKSLIGNGGSVIQSILKKYNVFIKFTKNCVSSESSSMAEVQNDFEPFFMKRRNNVLIKCPMKNQRSIMFVKHEIDQLVQQCWHNKSLYFNGISVIYNTVKFRLLKSHYILLAQTNNSDVQFVSTLEKEFDTFIDYPKTIDVFDGCNSVEFVIKGNDNKARLCAEKMVGYLPRAFDIEVREGKNPSGDSSSFERKTFREEIVIPFKILLHTELTVEPFASLAKDALSHKLTLSSLDEKKLSAAVSEISQYLKAQDIPIVSIGISRENPIVAIDEVSSPSKPMQRQNLGSRQKPSERSPLKSPKKNKFSNRTKNPLGVITNQQSVPILKSESQLSIVSQTSPTKR